jgi:hypothetical protein
MFRAVLAAGSALVCGVAHAATLSGIVALGTPDHPPPAAVYTVSVNGAPVVRGATLTVSWAAVNPAVGVFDWSALDAAIDAVPAGLPVAVGVEPGVNAPAWVYEHRVPAMPVSWQLGWQPATAPGARMCDVLSFPQPWGEAYVRAWTRLIGEFGRHYRHNDRVAAVKAAGLNVTTIELMLPTTPDGAGAAECGGVPPVPDSEWQAAGYTPDAVESTVGQAAHRYAAAFGWRQQIIWQGGPWAFPPATGAAPDMALMATLLVTAQQQSPGRFVVENDGLSSSWHWPVPAVLGAAPVGAQEAAPATGDAACRENHFVTPCDPVAVITAALAQARAAGAQFLEVYPADLENPALAGPFAGFNP